MIRIFLVSISNLSFLKLTKLALPEISPQGVDVIKRAFAIICDESRTNTR